METFDIKECIRDIRQEARNCILGNDSRILEIGPLNRPLLDRGEYSNYFFCDVRSTEEIKEFYKGNEYLRRTGLEVDIDSIIPIDYVLKNSYKKTFKGIEKFDYVIVLHVLEHIPNIIEFLVDISSILKKRGKLIIIYPDKRFSFDHFRSDTRFVDALSIYNGGKEMINYQELDFKMNVIPQNNATIFWDSNQRIENYLENKFEEREENKQNEDIHYWPFSDSGFLKFILDCNRFSLFKSCIEKFVPTQFNGQEFLIVLSYGKEFSQGNYLDYLEEANNYFFDNFLHLNDLRIQNKNKDEVISELNKKISLLSRAYCESDSKKVARNNSKLNLKNKAKDVLKKFF